MRLVARSGLEAVTMRAVAREAGLSYGSLFHYFESKDDLLMHAVRHSMALQTRPGQRIPGPVCRSCGAGTIAV